MRELKLYYVSPYDWPQRKDRMKGKERKIYSKRKRMMKEKREREGIAYEKNSVPSYLIEILPFLVYPVC